MQFDIKNVWSTMNIERDDQLKKIARNAEYLDMVDRGIA